MASSTNFQQLMCWAKTFKGPTPVHTVEPHFKIDSSGLGTSFINNTISCKMSDVFELNSWYKQWPTWGEPLATMDSQSEFLSVISTFKKNAILVQFFYEKKGKRLCEFSWNTNTLMAELKHYPLLNISRRVCIDVNKPIKSEHLLDLILGDIPLQNTVIIIDEWRGFGPGRVHVETACSMEFCRYTHLQPSESVIKDAKMYADKYLGGFEQYISVSARFEKLCNKYFTKTPEELQQKSAKAISMIKKSISAQKQQKQIEKVYLSYDFGKFGSITFRKKKFYGLHDLLINFQQDLYNNETTHDEYENSFKIFKQQNPAHIAMVQLTVAAKGKCLLQIGSGNCIKFTSYLFQSFHTPENLCMQKSIVFND